MSTITKQLYVCAVCQTQEYIHIEERSTEVCGDEIICDAGHSHYHDSVNTGNTTLVCKNGHTTQQPIIYKCHCGWDSANGNTKSSCTFTRKSLWGDDNDDW